jgi:hypothetical protein
MWYESIAFTNLLLILIVAVNAAVLLEVWRMRKQKP